MRRLCDREVKARIRLDAELPRPDAYLKLVIGKLDAGKIVTLPSLSGTGGCGTLQIHPELEAPLNISDRSNRPEAKHRIVRPGHIGSRTFAGNDEPIIPQPRQSFAYHWP